MDEAAALRELGARIRKARARAKLTQEAVAAKSGLHLTMVNRVENGRRNPTYLTLLRLADAIGVDLRRLV